MQECLNCEKYYEDNETEFCSQECADHWDKITTGGRAKSIERGLTHEDGSPNHGATSTTELINTLSKHFEGLRLKS